MLILYLRQAKQSETSLWLEHDDKIWIHQIVIMPLRRSHHETILRQGITTCGLRMLDYQENPSAGGICSHLRVAIGAGMHLSQCYSQRCVLRLLEMNREHVDVLGKGFSLRVTFEIVFFRN